LKRFSFPKTKRLVTNRQFKAVLDRNLRVSNGLITLFMAENDRGYPRLGVSVSKSCGNAATRNSLKRLLREAFRKTQNEIPAGFDYLLMISPKRSEESDKSKGSETARSPTAQKTGVCRLTFEQIEASFLALVARAVKKIG
jgi:ribonuclease P protein component